MRSHPYISPPPLPPILDELASYLPNQPGATTTETADRYSENYSDPGGGVALRDLDPDTSQLLPPPPRPTQRIHVRVQGKLALVQSVSSVDLRQSARRDGGRRVDPGVGSLMIPIQRRGRSQSPCVSPGTPPPPPRSRSEESESEEEDRQVVTSVRGDRQLRGYGIGGAGNIRRPTEVGHFRSRRISTMTLFSSVSSPDATSPIAATGGRRWNLRDLLGRNRVERKGKAKGAEEPAEA